MKGHKNLTFAQKNCISAAGKYMQETEMIHPGARIGVALSGGMDSFVLLQTLIIRKRIVPFDFELMVLHVNPGFDNEGHLEMARWVEERGLASHFALTTDGPDAHSEKNERRSPCFYCSWNRRKLLFNMCKQYGLTHLAMGHNADDLVTTFFMNMFQNGRVDGLQGKESFFGGELMMIRPLLMIKKSVIRRAAAAWELPIWENPCPSATNSKRSEYTEWIREKTAGNKKVQNNIYNALIRRQLDLDKGIT